MHRLSEKAVLFAPPSSIEPEALKQIENTASMPFVFKHVAVMPDCHFGKGATVGTVLATKGLDHPGGRGRRHRLRDDCRQDAAQAHDITDPAAIRAGIERRIPDERRPQQSDPHRERRRAHQGARVAGPRATTRRSIRTGSCSSARSAAATTSSSWRPTSPAPSGRRCTRARAASATKSATSTSAARKLSPKRTASRCPTATSPILNEGTKDFDDYVRDLLWAQEFARLNRDEMMDRVMMEISQQRLRRSRSRRRARRTSASTATTTSRRSKSTSARRCG